MTFIPTDVHALSGIPFQPLCGVDVPNTTTTSTAEAVTCAKCLARMGSRVTVRERTPLKPGDLVWYKVSSLPNGREYAGVVADEPRKLGDTEVVRLKDMDWTYSQDHHPGQNRTTVAAASTFCLRPREAAPEFCTPCLTARSDECEGGACPMHVPSEYDGMLRKLLWLRDTLGVDIERMFARAQKEKDGRASEPPPKGIGDSDIVAALQERDDLREEVARLRMDRDKWLNWAAANQELHERASAASYKRGFAEGLREGAVRAAADEANRAEERGPEEAAHARTRLAEKIAFAREDLNASPPVSRDDQARQLGYRDAVDADAQHQIAPPKRCKVCGMDGLFGEQNHRSDGPHSGCNAAMPGLRVCYRGTSGCTVDHPTEETCYVCEKRGVGTTTHVGEFVCFACQRKPSAAAPLYETQVEKDAWSDGFCHGYERLRVAVEEAFEVFNTDKITTEQAAALANLGTALERVPSLLLTPTKPGNVDIDGWYAWLWPQVESVMYVDDIRELAGEIAVEAARRAESAKTSGNNSSPLSPVSAGRGNAEAANNETATGASSGLSAGPWMVVRKTFAHYLGAYEWVRNPAHAAHFLTHTAAAAAAEVASKSNTDVTIELSPRPA